ncbi:MAG: 2Fe-2S iron-sulfur cluster binding domain-containing protein [Lachnospiraceae bacterium]|nr:2Fe-2S iron-sulfur cluster binding domain-containing protein [Lachnospiraceae bacterium]
MKIKGFLKDVGGASRVTKMRKALIENASPVPHPQDPIRELADALHPGKQKFVVTQVREASPTARTFRFEPFEENGVRSHIPPFQSGQYVNFYLTIGTSTVTRAYSISSAPSSVRGEKPFFEITIRRNVSYFVPDYFFKEVKEGSVLTAALPFSQFYYEPLRDAENVVALAGGSGITPFVSMAKEIAAGGLDCDLTILYGSVKHTDIVCGDELAEIAKTCPRVRVVHVMSDDPEWQGEKGFITTDLIRKYSCGIPAASGEQPEDMVDTTYMFCGPWAMYRVVRASMEELGVGPRRFRHDVMQQPSNVKQIPGFPEDQIGKRYQITVVRGVQEDVIGAAADEPVAVALERSAIPVDTHCRGGECGYCRSQLLNGDIFVSPLGDGRRAMDKEMGWFHACSAYPMSDLTIKIPIL